MILCERGIRTVETAMRKTLEGSAVPLPERWTSLPMIFDPSHAAGVSVEVRSGLLAVLCHPEQVLAAADLRPLVAKVRPIVTSLDRTF